MTLQSVPRAATWPLLLPLPSSVLSIPCPSPGEHSNIWGHQWSVLHSRSPQMFEWGTSFSGELRGTSLSLLHQQMHRPLPRRSPRADERWMGGPMNGCSGLLLGGRLSFPWYSQLGSHFPGSSPVLTMTACVHAKLLQSCLTLCNPWTVARQTPLSMGFSRQEYWSGLQCPPLWDPNP